MMQKHLALCSDTCHMLNVQQKKCQKRKKDLTSFRCHDRLVWRMEVGLFFMPKIRWGRSHQSNM